MRTRNTDSSFDVWSLVLLQVSGSLCTPFSERQQTLKFHSHDQHASDDAQHQSLEDQSDQSEEHDANFDAGGDDGVINQTSDFLMIRNLTSTNDGVFRINIDVDIVSKGPLWWLF